MKKMNFYFNPMKCCAWLLPMFLLLTGSMAFAGNGNTLTSAGPVVAKHNMAMPVVTLTGATLTATSPACPPAAATGSLTASGNVTNYNSPITVVVEYFLGGVSQGAFVAFAGTPASLATVTPFTHTVPNLAPGTYTARVTVENPLNTILEAQDLAPATINPQAAAAALAGTLGNVSATAVAGTCLAATVLTTNVTPSVNVAIGGVSAGTITANTCAGNVTVSGIPTSFPVGATVVNWTAVGSGGGNAAGSFTVTVTAPALSCTITNVTPVIAACGLTTQLLYTVNPVGGCAPYITEHTGIINNSTVTVGSYNVAAVVIDSRGTRSAPCTLPITVVAPVRPALVGGSLTNATAPIAACATTTTLDYDFVEPTGGCAPYTLEDVVGVAIGTAVPAGSYEVSARWRDAAGQLTPYFNLNIVVAAAVNTPLVGGSITNTTAAIAPCSTTTVLRYTLTPPTGGCGTIRLENTTGIAVGTTVPAGTYPVSATWIDAAGQRITATASIIVAPAPALPALVGGSVANNGTVAVVACAATTPLLYTLTPPTGGCAPIVMEDITGLANGALVGAGSHIINVTWRDAAGQRATATTTIVVAVDQTGGLTCLGAINFSLVSSTVAPAARSCSQVLRVVDVLPAGACVTGATIEVQRNGVWGSSTLTSADISKTLNYRVTRGTNTCWGTVTVEDKQAPTIACPPAITVQCNSVNATALLPTGTDGTGSPIVNDCSTFTTSYSDAMVSMGCLQSLARVVRRTWTAKDFYGNVSNSCDQLITVSRVLDATVPAADQVPVIAACPVAVTGTLGMFQGGNTEILCSTTGAAGAEAAINAVRGPYVLINSQIYFIGEGTVCGLSARIVDTRRLDLCPGSYKIVRIWRVTDLCGTLFPASNLTMTCDIQQVIVFKDDVAPTSTYSTTNFNLVADGTTTCSAVTAMIPAMIPATVKLQAVPVNTNMTATTTIKPRSTAGMCGAVDIDLIVTPADACGELIASPVTVNDNRLRVTSIGGGRWRITGTIMNVSTTAFSSFVVTFTDACGNFTKNTVQFRYEDNITPIAICDGVTATLNNLKTVTVTGASFNQRSSDNCGVTAVLVAKNTVVGGQDRPDIFCDEQSYGCIDTPRAGVNLKIWIRYIDFTGNYTDCCVPIVILDKAPISCSAVTIPSISCNDVTNLNNFSSLFVTPVVFYDGCDRIDTTITTDTSRINCGVGSYTRNWTFGAKNALGEQRTTVCSQTLNITRVLGFRVTPISNLPLTCSGSVPTAESSRQEVIRGLKILHAGGITTCSAPVVDVTESVYSNTEFCKVIVQTFVIKDLCDFSNYNSSITNNADRFTVVGGDYQSVLAPDGKHIIVFTRTITIKDVTTPTSNRIDTVKVCYIGQTTCNFGFTQDLNGDDLCTGGTSVPGVVSGSSLFYSWVIVNATTGVEITNPNSRGTTRRVSASGLAFGTYIVYYTVSDLCGNISIRYQFVVTGADCKAPEVLVHNKVVALAGQTGNSASGMARLNYLDIRNRITDNCEPTDLTNDGKLVMEIVLASDPTQPLAPRSTTPRNFVMFDCSHVGTQRVRVWMSDLAGNWNFAVSTITVQDNDGICGPRPPSVAGTVGTENNSLVKDVVVSVNANGNVAGSMTTPATGAFLVTNLTAGANYQVRAAKTIDTDKKNGVTTLDIALISKHNLGIETLNSPYKIIAADVNKDGEVDATDMLHIRRFVLNITPTLPAGSAWRFVDKSYAFRNPANPLGEDFSEVVNLTSLTGQAAANFTAVKLGDVNNSFDASQVRGSRALVFNANDMSVVAGNEYTVAINAENFNAAAFQGTFAFEGASVKAVKAGSLNNTSDANFGMFNNAVTASWNGKSEASADVVNITFIATKSGKLSEMLTVNSSVTMAEGYDAAGNAMNVSLKFNTGKVAGGEFALYANTPNPFSTSTTIGFNLPKDGQAKLTVYTASGKVLFVKNDNFKAGVNQVTVNKADLNASGLVYYRLDTQDNSSTKKMIIME